MDQFLLLDRPDAKIELGKKLRLKASPACPPTARRTRSFTESHRCPLVWAQKSNTVFDCVRVVAFFSSLECMLTVQPRVAILIVGGVRLSGRGGSVQRSVLCSGMPCGVCFTRHFVNTLLIPGSSAACSRRSIFSSRSNDSNSPHGYTCSPTGRRTFPHLASACWVIRSWGAIGQCVGGASIGLVFGFLTLYVSLPFLCKPILAPVATTAAVWHTELEKDRQMWAPFLSSESPDLPQLLREQRGDTIMSQTCLRSNGI